MMAVAATGCRGGTDPTSLAGRFVVAGADTGPRGQIGRGGEPAHVGAGLEDDHLDRQPLETKGRQQKVVYRLERRRADFDLLGEGADRRVEEVEVIEDALSGDGSVWLFV